ncbi:putative aminoacyltransferase, E1 ubiquitin-activating enzyme [Rosa chinensis]|uniref:Putative aminoacyltransferase, E1 ubiquitin-activating enzyme n=1 Tax=Rosa chinensis TaxID=74649 RepID=A0A2P6RU36_ROSCH|nr:putative E3 ubiquitin-protein ligase RING1a isoform X2 [Rosa chinensis]PRQ49946.1 putative aminoacyltransferase, E1 ubiquitin-activating enzyme [Rosa chinensis]
MPAQKRSLPDNLTDDDDDDPTPHHRHRPKQSRPQDELLQQQQQEQQGDVVVEKQQQQEEEEEDEEENDDVEEEEEEDEEYDRDEVDDYDGSPSSTSQQNPEFVLVQLADIRKDVHCPICLGIIKKTRTVMECLHRFCRECIDKSMRMGNNECPACRTHCASRRSLRDDPNYDAIIATLYPDIEKYEKEELAFHEEERTRNEQIQASIAQIFQRQSEALIKRRSLGKDTQDAYNMRSLRNNRSGLRRRRNSQATELQGFEDNEDETDTSNLGTKSPSAEERHTEVRPRRLRRRTGFRSSQPSSSVTNSNGGCTENDVEVSRENRGISPGLVWSSEMLAWGRGGARSHTRHGIASGCSNKSSRSTRLSKLVDYLRNLKENNDELDVHLMLISLDKRCTPNLQQPHLCCRPSLSVKHLCEYVARQTPLQAEEVELFSVNGHHNSNDEKLTDHPSVLMNDLDSVPLLVDPCRYDLQILQAEETLAGIKANCTSSRDRLILAYRRKEI